MHKHWLSAIAILLGGCGVEFVKPATSDELKSYTNVISFAKDRYTSFRASMGTSHWWQGAGDDVEVAAFRISSNKSGWLGDHVAFERDLESFCTEHNGQYTTLFKPDVAKVAFALANTRNGAATGAFLRERNGNPPTFSCSSGPGTYLFYGEAMYWPEANDGVSIKIRLNQGLVGSALQRARPSVQ